MDFKKWFVESTLDDLYQSAVDAFPHTTKRQHATHTIKITKLLWRPYKGMNTLFIRGLAQNEGREYNPMVLFKKVKYHEASDPGTIHLQTDVGEYDLEPILFDAQDALLRCNCSDFYWRFNYYDHLDKSLYGRKRAKYEALRDPGSANPMKMPGMCKHLMKMMQALGNSGILV